MTRRVVVEIELGDDEKLENVIRGARYRVLRRSLWEGLERLREKHVARLGGTSSLEEYQQLEEELWLEE